MYRLLTIFLVVLVFNVGAQVSEEKIDSIFTVAIQNKTIPSAIISIVNGDSGNITRAYGIADIAHHKKADVETLFQIGSVGKIMTSLAVMNLVEEGKLNYDRPVTEYLTNDPLREKVGEGITLRHLLSHTAGLDERIIGYATRDIDDIEPLGMHLADRFPDSYTEPGKEISYSNYGYALAGYLVEKVSGVSFVDFVEGQIFAKIGMQDSKYFPVTDMAAGYDNNREELPAFYRHPIPAGGVWSTARDMEKFLRYLIDADGLEELFTVQFTGNTLLGGYTIGLEEQKLETPTFAKGGAVPGFRSVLIIYPEMKRGMFASVNISNDEFLESFVKDFNRNLVNNRNPYKGNHEAQDYFPERYVGSYRENRYNRKSVEDVVSLIYFNIWKTSEGHLGCYHDGEYQSYIPIDSVIFQNTKDPNRFIVFHADEEGKITGMSRSNSFAGTQIPVRYEKVPWYDEHWVVNELSGWLIFIILSYLLYPVLRGMIFLIRKWRPGFAAKYNLSIGANITAFSFALLTLSFLILYFFPVLKGLKSSEFLFGFDESLLKYNYLSFILIANVILLASHNIISWKSTSPNLAQKVYYTIITVSGILFLWFLHHWHFIGVNI